MIKGLQLKAVFWLSVGTWALILFLSGKEVGETLFKPASLVLGIVTVVVAFFERIAWRWPIFRWLVSMPNLVGTYKGVLKSSWINPKTGSGVPPIEAYLSIHQTLSGLTARLFTIESGSKSICATLAEDDDHFWTLVYTYCNEPGLGLQTDSRIHHGGVRLQVHGENTELTGSYWTDRLTNGEMEFKRISHKTSANFKDAKLLDPSQQSSK